MVKIQITEVILPYCTAVSNDYDNNLFGKTVNKTLSIIINFTKKIYNFRSN